MNNFKILFLSVLLFIAGAGQTVNGQSYFNNNLTNQISASIGYENSLLTRLSYTKNIATVLKNRPLQAQFSYGFPVIINPIENNKISLGIFSVPSNTPNNIDWSAGVSAHYKNADDLLSKTSNISGELMLEAGIYKPKFLVALRSSLNYSFANHFKFKDYYNNTFEEIANDSASDSGWYSINDITTDVGIHLSWLVFNKLIIDFNGGYRFLKQKQGLSLFIYTGNLPFYGNINFGYKF